jgi:membrane protein DedA with SNARE-associated domain
VIEQCVAWLTGLPAANVYRFIAVLAGLENIFPPVPADTAVALGAFLSSRSEGLTWWGVYVATLVPNVATAAGVFQIAATHGRTFFASRTGRKLVSERAMLRIGRLYDRHHFWGIFVSRFLPGYRAVVPPFAAVAGLPLWKALPPIVLASGLYYGLLTLLAYHFGRNWDAVRSVVARFSAVLALAAVAATVLIAVLVWRHRHHLRADGD